LFENILPPLPIQYADYALWQRAWLDGAVLDGQLDYWRRQLAGLPALRLPTDRPRPPVATDRGARQDFQLPAALGAQLRALGRQAGTTPFMTLLATFKLLLSWYSGQDDIVVGTTVANRSRAEVEGLIGFFANQLVLRTSLAGDPTFRELLGRVREVCLQAYANQDVPFEKLVEALNPVRDLSHSPLFQVKFLLQNTPAPALASAELALDGFEVEHQTTKFELFLNMVDDGAALGGALEYSTDLFTPGSIARMLGFFEALLRHVVAHADSRVSALAASLTEADRQQRIAQEQAIEEVSLKRLRNVRRRPSVV
jgi:non-ribosomal peptide synthetase component F